MNIEHFLKTIGLTENETRIYLYLLTTGASIASIIAKRLNIKRTAMYALLETLEQKEMIFKFEKNGVQHFDAVKEDEIVEMCEKKAKETQQILKKAETLREEFSAIRKKREAFHKLDEKLQNPILEIRGKVSYYEGLQAVTNLITETLDIPEEEQLCFGLNSYHTEMAGRDWKHYTEKRVEKGMFVRSIQPKTTASASYKKRDSAELRKTYLVPFEKFPGECELNIIGDTIALFSTKESEVVGMKITNRYMAQAMRSLFDLAWEKAEFYDGESK